MKCSSLAFAVLFVLLSAAVVQIYAQNDVELSNAPSCSAEQVKDWSFIRQKMLGVAGRDLTGHEVGSFAAKKRIVINLGLNWFPMSGSKETLCGKLDTFSFYPGLWDLDREEDWNNFIIPDDEFKYLITDVQKIFPKAVKSTAKCDPNKTTDCIEVEVTVHDDFFENPYFTRNEGAWWEKDKPASKLAGQRICTYGTWIREKVHQDHPELHPSELFWWTEPLPSGTTNPTEWWLMAVQDNSKRFDELKHFGPEPVTASPWAGSPRANSFKLALEVKPGDPTLNYRIEQRENYGVVSSLEDTGTTHVVRYNGSPLISLTEAQPTENVGVRFDFCRDESASRLLGYAELITRLKADDDGNSGYQVLRVAKEEGLPAVSRRPATPATPQLTPRARLEIVANSLRREIADGKPRLVADMKLEMPLTAGSQPDIVKNLRLLSPGKKEKLEIRSGPEVTPANIPQSQVSVLLMNVPVGAASPQDNPKFEVETPQRKQTFEVRNFALVPELNREQVREQSTDEGALQNLLVAAGVSTPASQPQTAGIQTAKAEQLRIDVTPSYSTLRENVTPVPEEDAPVPTLLNRSISKAVLNNDFEEVERLFNTKVPFKITDWTFKAVNPSTGQEVPVREVAENSEAADVNEVRIARGSGVVANGNLKVLFPKNSQREIYELQMRATMRDTNGFTGVFEHRVWSHFITLRKNVAAVEDIMRFVAQQTAVSYDELAQLWQVSSDKLLPDVRSRRAQIFRTLARQAAEDQKVNLEELQTLVRAAKLVSER